MKVTANLHKKTEEKTIQETKAKQNKTKLKKNIYLYFPVQVYSDVT